MKKIITLCLSLCLTATLAAPAYALEYSIDAPDDYDFGRDTSIEVIHTADGGAMKNTDVSKNAALIPPAFGSESMNALHTGEYLTPNLAPGGIPASGSVIGGGASGVVTPGSTVSGGNYQPSVLFTDVTSELYYKNGSLGKIEIPAIRERTARRLPKALGILKIPPSGRAMSASPPITAAPTATSGRSTR